MNCIVNVDQNWGIGKEDNLLFTISADLRRFRELTTGKTVVLGRKTLSTFPGGNPLKNRRNIILTKDQSFCKDGAEAVHSTEEALALLREIAEDEICIIGGASIYEAFLPYCKHASVTKTLADGSADRFFPNLDTLPNWEATWTSEVMEENGVQFQYVDYVNHSPLPY